LKKNEGVEEYPAPSTGLNKCAGGTLLVTTWEKDRSQFSRTLKQYKQTYMPLMLALFNLGGGEIILILTIVLILFGAKKLPELAKGLGQGIKEFKKAAHNASEGMRDATEDKKGDVGEYPAPTSSLDRWAS
jgi:sec-independent protein translocase protein TatA